MLLDASGPPGLRADDGPDARLAIELWSAVRGLAWVHSGNYVSTVRSELPSTLARLAAETEAQGDPDLSYHLLACGVLLMDENDPGLGDTAAAALPTGLSGPNVFRNSYNMSAKRAVAAITAAVLDHHLRSRACDLAEIAIERIGTVDEEFQADLVEIINPLLYRYEWLKHLRARLSHYLS